MNQTPASPKTLLVYSDGEIIGDGMVKLPFIMALKKSLPDAHLTWMCSGKSVYAQTLAELAEPVIDEIQYAPTRHISGVDFLRAPLFDKKIFDIVIDTQKKLIRTLWLRNRIRNRLFISAAAGYRFSDRRPHPIPQTSSITAQLAALGGAALNQSPIDMPPVRLENLQYMAHACSLLPDGPLYVGFAPGAGKPDKKWPLQRFIALAQSLPEHAVPVFILGPAEQDMVEEIKAALPNARLPLPPGASPCLTIALAGRLTAAIANDSGGGHLIAAGVPAMVSLFRKSSVRDKFTPAAGYVIALAPEDFNGQGITDIPLDAARTALHSLLG